ncbi:uncharacterized protein LOC142579619 [Dermacentor variabilis]|uniref:uncharacterized protein LOC142579619 n=1 Tax=Dermacentor variabilis TaxID=34621 RepID=UPI003F5B3A9B
MEQQNDATASPPSPTAANQPPTAGRPLGEAKGGTGGQSSPLSSQHRLRRGPRGPAANASPSRSRKRSPRRRSPSRSASASPSRTSPLPSTNFDTARARLERNARPSPGRARRRTATLGQSIGSPSAEKIARTLQPLLRPVTTAGTGGRLTSAPLDRNEASAVETTDHGGVLPAGTLGTAAAGATTAAVPGDDNAAHGRDATNVPSLLQKRSCSAIGPSDLGSATTKEQVPPGRSASTRNSTFPFYDPRSRTPLTSTFTRRNHTRLKPEFVVGILSCVLLALVLVVGIVRIALSPSAAATKLCVTHACQAYSLQLISSINRSVDPCVHFTHFVCDGWQMHHNLDVWERHFLRFISRLDARLKTIDVPAAGQNEEQRSVAVYRSCDNVYRGKSDELPAVKAALALAGIVWPQPSRGADALFTLLYSSFKLGWDAVANFRVAPRSGEAVDELVISQGTSFGMLREWFAQEKATAVKRAYYEYIRRQFTGDNGTTVDDEVSYEFVWEIAAPATKALTPFFGLSEAAPQPADWLVNSHGAHFTETRWIDALRRVDISLPDGLRISADNRLFFETLLRMWEHYGEDDFHLFVSWCTVQVAALYANKGLILNYYRQIPRRVALYHKAFCVSRAVFFSQAIIARYSGDVLETSAAVVAKEIALSVRLAFSHRLSTWPYYNENVTVVANWSSLESAFRHIEYDNKGRTDSRARDDMPDMTDSFVANWQHSVRLNKTRQVVELAYAMRRLWFFLSLRGDNDIQMMPYALSFPFLDPNLPTPVNFGGFGSEVVAALGSLSVGSYKAYSNATDYLLNCLKGGRSVKHQYSEAYVNGVFGYRALVDAYKRTAPTTLSLKQLEHYSDMQLLFMSSCFLMCPGRGRGQQNECDMLAQHVPEFSETFKCSQGAIVNTTDHCEML